MKTIRVICDFLLSLVRTLFPRGLKARHCPSGNPVAGSDSTAVAPVETAGIRSGGNRSDLVGHPSGETSGPSGSAGLTESAGAASPPGASADSRPEERPPASLTAGNLLGWLLIVAATVKLFC